MARGRSSREFALPPSGWPSPYRSKESWAGMLLERLMLLLPGGRLYWLMLVGLTAEETHTHTYRSVLYLLNASEIIHAGNNHHFPAEYNWLLIQNVLWLFWHFKIFFINAWNMFYLITVQGHTVRQCVWDHRLRRRIFTSLRKNEEYKEMKRRENSKNMFQLFEVIKNSYKTVWHSKHHNERLIVPTLPINTRHPLFPLLDQLDSDRGLKLISALLSPTCCACASSVCVLQIWTLWL